MAKSSKWIAVAAVVAFLVTGAFYLGTRTPSTERVTEVEAETPDDLLESAHQMAESGNYREAVELFERVRLDHPGEVESVEGLCFAIVYTKLGDQKKHEALCRWMFERFPGDEDLADAERTAKAYLLNVDADDPELLKEAAKRIDYGVQNAKDWEKSWFNVAQGIVRYREGRYRDASALLQNDVKHDHVALRSLARAFHAMAEYSAGERANPSKTLNALRAEEQRLARADDAKYWDVLASRLALAEAEVLLSQSGAKTKTPTASQEQPDTNYLEEANRLSSQGDYLAAVQAFEKVRQSHPQSITALEGLQFAIMYMALDNPEAHEDLCRWLFNQYPGLTDASAAGRTAKAYYLYSKADDADLMDEAEVRARFALDQSRPGQKGWRHVGYGVALYRQQDYANALEQLGKVLRDDNIQIQSLALSFAAMAEHAQGKASRAKTLLDDARAANSKLPEIGTPEYARQHWDTLASTLALAEAESALANLSATKSPEERLQEAFDLAGREQYRESIQILEEIWNKNAEALTSGHCVTMGLVYTLAGIKEDHMRFSRWVLDRYEDTSDALDAEHAAKAYLMFPFANDEELLDKSIRLTRIGVENADTNMRALAWVYLSHAMALYRLGEFDECTTWLQHAENATKDRNRNPVMSVVHGYSALNEIAKGNPGGAEEHVRKSKEFLAKLPKNQWDASAHGEIVLAEVEAALR